MIAASIDTELFEGLKIVMQDGTYVGEIIKAEHPNCLTLIRLTGKIKEEFYFKFTDKDVVPQFSIKDKDQVIGDFIKKVLDDPMGKMLIRAYLCKWDDQTIREWTEAKKCHALEKIGDYFEV